MHCILNLGFSQQQMTVVHTDKEGSSKVSHFKYKANNIQKCIFLFCLNVKCVVQVDIEGSSMEPGLTAAA